MGNHLLTVLTMLAFAANSILCRLALGENTIDAASFTAIRLISGAIMLVIILLYRHQHLKKIQIDPVSVFMLFVYAICFSYSYTHLSIGTGALILFGSVQLTMVSFGLGKGERPGIWSWMGIACAFAGLIYLLMPSLDKPPLVGALLMVAAGMAWGVYSLRGKGEKEPLSATCWNFVGTLPLVMLSCLFFHADAHTSAEGVTLAVLSGALASSIGYVIWYSVIPHIKPINAATVQLSVPVIAAFGGVIVMSESISERLTIAGVVVLGGIYLTIASTAKTGSNKKREALKP